MVRSGDTLSSIYEYTSIPANESVRSAAEPRKDARDERLLAERRSARRARVAQWRREEHYADVRAFRVAAAAAALLLVHPAGPPRLHRERSERVAEARGRELRGRGVRGARADARPPPEHVDPPRESRRAPDALAGAQSARERAVVDRRGGRRAIRVAHCIAGRCRTPLRRTRNSALNTI